ncbi:hypothetical protein SAMN05421805_121102 [Saccharopolyspora antimicrobica]|uniref:Uncharacterized protein n=1 Tax=Saccharopolyspora antimicrobica TaxID=455193 RepID=A0A1I5J849_9PSEU|nr:hypothetical protein [Saccharopolyspora antimicrobica]RKT82063.1 hypothetical protein ATL45_0304 [Saccharopolyspora antimicrobica]SFO68551.1 hypothetical protein SAMN05421805_121102 [Saccharopolyspora antimicrobica]
MSDSDDRGRVRRFRKWFVIAAVVLLVGAGGYGFWQQYPAAMVGRACGGMLSVDPFLELSGASRLSLIGSDFVVRKRTLGVPPGVLGQDCEVGVAEVQISRADDRYTGLRYYAYASDDFPVPLEAGWSGFVSDANRFASVMVDCRNWGSDEGTGFVVTTRLLSSASVPDPRPKLVRAVIETARSTAEQTGCDAQLGEDAELAVPEGGTRATPAAEASGTCAGMSSVETVQETDAGTALFEVCKLYNSGLEFTARYGHYEKYETSSLDSFSKPSSADRSLPWTSATCASPFDRGLYIVDKSGTEPLTDAELADLQRFAQQSAARHGCNPPEPIDRAR